MEKLPQLQLNKVGLLILFRTIYYCCSASLPTYFSTTTPSDRLKLQHIEVARVNSLALVSQSPAKHLLNLISDDSSKHSCSLF